MRIKTVILLILTIVIFCQCRSIQLSRIERSIKKTAKEYFLNQRIFDHCQKLMFKKLPSDINKNDTIIILEYFTDITPFYYCTIYQSENKVVKKYRIVQNNNGVYPDSLTTSSPTDGILTMVINNQLDEVRKRGKAPGWTPETTLIINILTKDKEKNKYNLQTIRTKEFSTHKEMPQDLWEETRKAKPYIKSD